MTTKPTGIIVTHVHIQRAVVGAWVTTRTGRSHYIGHLPYEGWFCNCKSGKRCTQIVKVKDVVAVKAVEANAQIIEAGTGVGQPCGYERIGRPRHADSE